MRNLQQDFEQNLEQPNSGIRELTDADLEAVSAGSIMGGLGRWIERVLAGSGDQRRRTG